MNITFVGAGYVGLVSAACFAEVGHSVLSIDRDVKKVESLSTGKVPFYEKGLKSLLHQGLDSNRLRFSTNLIEGISFGDLIFIAVDTPPKNDGSANLNNIMEVATTIGQEICDYKIVVIKSTVPAGTSSRIRTVIQHH